MTGSTVGEVWRDRGPVYYGLRVLVRNITFIGALLDAILDDVDRLESTPYGSLPSDKPRFRIVVDSPNSEVAIPSAVASVSNPPAVEEKVT